MDSGNIEERKRKSDNDATSMEVENQSGQAEPFASIEGNVSKKVKKNTSDVWNYFTKIGKVDGKEKVECVGCKKTYSVGGKDYGTSHLRRHINICAAIPKYKDVGAMMLDHAGNVRVRKLDQNKVRDLLAYCIIRHDVPYSFVEWEAVRDLCSYLNPDYRPITRKTVTVDVMNFYLKAKENLKNQLARSPGRVCLTADCWTSLATEGYLCLTAHFIDEKWNLNSKILAFARMKPPHSGIELSNKAHDIITDWGIEGKIFSITLDNASANDNMQNLLRDRLNLCNGLICNGEFFHVRCCAHILNLIVQEGLTVASSAVQKIRSSITYVKHSDSRLTNFRKCVQQVGGIDSSMGLRLDVPTRWNSTHSMLQSAIKYRRAFVNLSLHDSNYRHCPSPEEWTRAEVMCAFLKPFAVITNLMSGSSYPTANMYFMQISKIETLLKQHVESDDLLIQDMAERMLRKFDKYWGDCSVILALANILDPRMKFDVVKFSYVKLDPINYEEKIEHIRRKLYYVFNEYKSLGSSSSSLVPFVRGESSSNVNMTPTMSFPQSGVESSTYDENNYLDAFEDFFEAKNKDIEVLEKSELDFYLEEATLDPRLSVKFNLLSYWMTNAARFPYLSKMACDILSIPITTVASESAFSIGSRVLTKYRSCLLPENVEAIICARNWMLGYSWDETKEEEAAYCSADDTVTVSDNASNNTPNIVE